MSHFVLVDCNNFYVSCERVFNPRLEGCPVIILSNNDGCIVARSQEAKLLGIGMGEPFFKVKELCERQKVVVYSSNYHLYGDLSGRVMSILSTVAPDLQIYSIDEAFLQLPAALGSEEVADRCKELRRIIKQWVGIPTSIGIASSKTLAKVATKLAKTNSCGVVDLSAPSACEDALRTFPIREIWGIGAALEDRLHGMGIRTAWELCQKDPSYIRRCLGVAGERMLWELRGINCLPLEKVHPNKSITCSRSFGRTVQDCDEMAEAISAHAASACEQLREQHLCAYAMTVYVMALVDSKTGDRRCFGTTVSFLSHTNNTPEVIRRAKECLQQIFSPGQRYKKCGVIMIDLVSETSVAPDLFLGGFLLKHRRILETVDALNKRFGKNTVFYGAMGIDRSWKVRSDSRSSRYTTCWDELPIVKA
jgi:DNA polymerase V